MSARAIWLRTMALGVAVLLMAPSAARAQRLAIIGGTVHTLAGDAIENGTVIVEGGRIVSVGVGLPAPAGADVVDATGLHVYPGMFNAFSDLGLKEINSVAVTNDNAELGDFNPQLVAATAIHPASERIPVTRANGVTHVVAAPSARPGGIGGQATVISLDGWTIEEMELAHSVGMVVNWPALATQRCSPFGCFGPSRPFKEAKKTHDEAVEQLHAWLDEARRYGRAAAGGDAGHRDLRLEALAAAANREMPFLVIADAARDIRDAVAFADEEDIEIVIVSGRDAAQVADLLADHEVPVLLRAEQNMPNGEDDSYSQTFGAAATLHEAGVRFAMTGWGSAGPNPPSRTLPYEAADAVGFGLPAEEALRAITRYPAEILGLGDELGTIEEGKIANLIVTDGDPLQIRTQMRYVIINGAVASLENKHKTLWEKYRARR
jgi:imidazolonepropionase-like amidohydrolase